MLQLLRQISSQQACYAFVVIAFALVVYACCSTLESRRRMAGIAFLGVSFVALYVSRLPILGYDRPINPDEALMAANAMRARHGWINWDIVDPLTAGPLDSMVLAWPSLLGLDITFFWVRVTAILLLGLSLSALYSSIRKMTDDRAAMVAVFPVYALLIFTNFYDFVHYSSEIMPVFLISTAILGFVSSLASGAVGPLILAAFLAGCVPFAKLQGTPIAAALGAFVLAWAIWSRPRREAGWWHAILVFLAACLPAAIFLLPLAIGDGLDDFFKSYFVQQRLRFEGADWDNKLPGILSGTTFGAMALGYVPILVLGGVALFMNWREMRQNLSIPAIWFILLAAVLLPVSFLAVAAPGRDFPHYLLLSLPALVVLGGAGCLLVHLAWKRFHWPSALGMSGVLAAVLIFLVPVLAKERSGHQYWSYEWHDGAMLQGRAFTSPRVLQWLRPDPGDSLVCWGWRPECHVDAALPPATREATNENQLYWTSLKSYFRARFLADLQQSDPEFIIDFVAPGSFYFENPADDGIPRFPEFAAFVNEGYRMGSSVKDPNRCPRLYVRRDRADRLERSKVAIASISAGSSENGFDPASVDDGSIFESCVDYWLPPDATGGTLDLAFREPALVRRILVLNTRNGIKADRSSELVRLTLRSEDRIVWIQEVALEKFPHWTTVEIADPAITADALQVEILSYRGDGGGLNEIKIYRD